MTRKRGTRRIVGYVVSLSGKRGGPYASGVWCPHHIDDAERFDTTERERAERVAKWWKAHAIPPHPHARVLPVVRYELDREEERLRDAVVDGLLNIDKARDAYEKAAKRADPRHVVDDALVAVAVAMSDLQKAEGRFATDWDALRAHLEKKG
jgi:hypothetical protein